MSQALDRTWQYYRVILKEVAGNVYIPGYSLYYIDVFYSFQRPVTKHNNSLALMSFRKPHSFLSILSISPRTSPHSLAFLQLSHLLLRFLSPPPYYMNRTRQSMALSTRRRGAHTISGPLSASDFGAMVDAPISSNGSTQARLLDEGFTIDFCNIGVFGQTLCPLNTICPLFSPISSSSPKFKFQIVLLLILFPSLIISFSHTSILKVE